MAVAALVLAAAALPGCSAHQPTSGAYVPSGLFALAWPSDGRLSSRFGPRWGSHHEGIDIACPQGTPVRVAADGVVTFSGVQRGYGQVVIVEHPRGVSTLYAHNSRNLVEVGTRITRGSVIALSGRTGRATGPHVHFEIRKDTVARDPLLYLPAQEMQDPVPNPRHIGG